MKILYFISFIHTSGGMERVLTLKANYLADVYGYDIGIVVLTKEEKPFFELSKKVKLHFLNLQSKDTVSSNTQKLLFNKHYNNLHYFLVEKLIKKEKPNVCISLFGNELYFLHKIKDGSKKVVEFHSSKQSFLIQARQGKWGFIKEFYTKNLLKQIKKELFYYDRFVCLTESDYDDWGHLKNSRVIYNPNTFKVPENFSIDYTQKRVLSVGGIALSKGYDLLIEAWSLVVKQFPEWEMCIVGRRNDNDSLDSLIFEKQLQNSIKVFPVTNDILSYYQSSSIYISSSRFEGFPMTLLEAASCGLPIVAFNTPTGPSEIIHNEEDGLIAEYLNIHDLAEKLKRLMHDSKLRKEFGLTGKKNIQRFSMDKIMKEWNELLINL